MNILKKRSRGYTSVSVLITVAVLALVMLANTVFTVLASHFSLFIDLTDTSLWTLSDEAKAVIAEADGDITITFCHEKDYIESSSTMRYISRTAEEIAKEFPNIEVRYINSILEPKLVEKYKYTDVSTIKTTASLSRAAVNSAFTRRTPSSSSTRRAARPGRTTARKSSPPRSLR